ncbi:MAG: VOC family protein [Planctomycetaceae bacterium]
MLVQPYLNFDGRCEEAITFYRKAVGAEVLMLMRNNESPEPCDPGVIPPGSDQKVLHASLRIGESIIMATDGYCKGAAKFEGMTLSLSVANAADADRYFSALGDGGTVTMPLTKTFFSAKFGMLIDRFGVTWMVLVGK